MGGGEVMDIQQIRDELAAIDPTGDECSLSDIRNMHRALLAVVDDCESAVKYNGEIREAWHEGLSEKAKCTLQIIARELGVDGG
jgi:hypothetical protein